MTQNQNKAKTDAAWNRLYGRLETDGLLSTTNERKRATLIRPVFYRWAAAIAVICISAASLFLLAKSDKIDKENLLTLQNKKGAVTLVTTLEDGSIVYLADNTKLDYPIHFEKKTREVFLKGNALFDVTGNKERPFLIETKDILVEVLGTSFYIKDETGTAFELAVKRGRVKVIRKKDGQQKLVTAGETVRLLSDKLTVSQTENNTLFDHYTNKIQFKDETLGNILRVINRTSDGLKLEAIPELNNRPLTFTFSSNSPENVAQLICLALDLTYTKKDGILLISEMN